MRRGAARLLAALVVLSAGLLAGCTYYPTIYDAGGIRIRPQNGRAVQQPAGLAVYMDLASTGKFGDTIVGATSEIARRATLVAPPGGQPVTRLEVPGEATVRLTPDGAHIVLSELTRPVRPGETVLVTVLFERLGRIGVPTHVE
jgi:copper(I)-binding protein